MTSVNEDHTVLPATHTFMPVLPSLSRKHHCTLAGTHFPSRCGHEAKFGLGGWLHTEVVCMPEDGHPSQY